MPEEYLATAFEIKTACDEISRRLLRWHWEQKPGSHSLNALLEHLEQRRKESPVYYDRLPDLSAKTNWNQWDTTLCMRVLLDPEKDAARPLDLLGNTPRPAAARRACNAVRTARNEAAHAADRAGSAQAAILFNEAVECLEDGYGGTALRESDLQQYYRQAEEFLARSGKTGKSRTEEPSPPRSTASAAQKPARKKAEGGSRASAGDTARRAAPSGARTKSGGTRVSAAKKPAAKAGGSRSKTRTGGARTKKSGHGSDGAFWLLLLLAVAAGLLLRAYTMGFWGA